MNKIASWKIEHVDDTIVVKVNDDVKYEFELNYNIISGGDGCWSRKFKWGDLVKFVDYTQEHLSTVKGAYGALYSKTGDHEDPDFSTMHLCSFYDNPSVKGIVIDASPNFVDKSNNRLIRVLMGERDCFLYADQIEVIET